MPDYLDEPSEEEIKLTESMRDADAETEEAEKAKPEQEDVQETGEEKISNEAESKSDEAVTAEPKVNLGALHEARAQNKELRGELGQAREKMAGMEGRLDQILKQIKSEGDKPKTEPVEEGPSYEEDPEGFYRHQIASLRREVDGLKTQGKQTDEQGKQAEEQQRFLASYRASAQEFGTKQADFMQAYEWLSKDVDAELQARGYIDPMMRQQIMAEEERRMAALAFDANVNPAERLYDLAKRRGYKAKPPEQDDKIVDLEKAKGKAKSLGGAGGGGTENTGTLEGLAQLEGPEFDKAWEKLRRAGKLG